ncbi:PAQR family membrane homeostasis protein TrhA [Ancylomarina sp. YFZ004]
MMQNPKNKTYSPLEEGINIYSHALGFLSSFIGSIVLFRYAYLYGGVKHLLSFSIFGMSMMILFAASTFYHRAVDPIKRARLRIFDHASIYVLIAGTYTPFCLVTLPEKTGLIVFAVVWGFALIGIIIKLFFTGRFSVFSTLMYLFMGWMMVFIIKPLYQNLPVEGLYWLFSGGLAYTLGAILYSIKRIPLNHASFHILVLVGCFCHYMGIYLYVL